VRPVDKHNRGVCSSPAGSRRYQPFLSAKVSAVSIEQQQRMTWSIARLLQQAYGHLKFRKSVLVDPVLDITLDKIIAAPGGLGAFLARCDGVPGCGDAQIDNIHAALPTEIRLQAHLAAASGDNARAQSLAAILDHAHATAEAATSEITGQFLPGDAAGLEDVSWRMWRQAPAERFHYLPVTLPDCAKSRELVAAELGTDAPVPLDAKGSAPGVDLGQATRGVILIDAQVLDAMRARLGRYAVLSDRAITAQMARLLDFSARLPPGIDAFVTDFARARLSAAAIFGGRAILPAPGGYVVLFSPPRLAQMVARWEAARQDAQPLTAYLAALI
jgi:hypothetical protein